jgi:hypothetical protein
MYVINNGRNPHLFWSAGSGSALGMRIRMTKIKDDLTIFDKIPHSEPEDPDPKTKEMLDPDPYI